MTTASKIKWFLLIVMGVLMLIIAFQNLEVVEVRILLWDRQMTKALLLAGTALIGFVMGLLARTLWQVRAWRRGQSQKS